MRCPAVQLLLGRRTDALDPSRRLYLPSSLHSTSTRRNSMYTCFHQPGTSQAFPKPSTCRPPPYAAPPSASPTQQPTHHAPRPISPVNMKFPRQDNRTGTPFILPRVSRPAAPPLLSPTPRSVYRAVIDMISSIPPSLLLLTPPSSAPQDAGQHSALVA